LNLRPPRPERGALPATCHFACAATLRACADHSGDHDRQAHSSRLSETMPLTKPRFLPTWPGNSVMTSYLRTSTNLKGSFCAATHPSNAERSGGCKSYQCRLPTRALDYRAWLTPARFAGSVFFLVRRFALGVGSGSSSVSIKANSQRSCFTSPSLMCPARTLASATNS
jgi:hypothetical protein